MWDSANIDPGFVPVPEVGGSASSWVLLYNKTGGGQGCTEVRGDEGPLDTIVIDHAEMPSPN